MNNSKKTKTIHPPYTFVTVHYADKKDLTFVTRSVLPSLTGKTEYAAKKSPMASKAWTREHVSKFSHEDTKFFKHFGSLDISLQSTKLLSEKSINETMASKKENTPQSAAKPATQQKKGKK